MPNRPLSPGLPPLKKQTEQLWRRISPRRPHDDAAPVVKPVAVLGDDHQAQGHGPHDLDVMAPRLVLEAGDGDDVGPVIRLHEDAGGVGASHVEGGGTLPLCHQGIVNTVDKSQDC